MDPMKCLARTKTGSASSRKLRRLGSIPLNLYQKNGDNILLSVKANEFIKHQNKLAGSKVFPIEFEKNGDTVHMNVLIKEQQNWAWKNQIVHMDLREIQSGDIFEVDVPVVPFGECIGVKEGGILNNISDTVRIRCTMDKLPKRLQADISALRPGHALHVKDLILPEGVEFVTPLDQVLITVVETRATKEEAAAQQQVEDGKGGTASAN